MEHNATDFSEIVDYREGIELIGGVLGRTEICYQDQTRHVNVAGPNHN